MTTKFILAYLGSPSVRQPDGRSFLSIRKGKLQKTWAQNVSRVSDFRSFLLIAVKH
jgi:hypothetical protein